MAYHVASLWFLCLLLWRAWLRVTRIAGMPTPLLSVVPLRTPLVGMAMGDTHGEDTTQHRRFCENVCVQWAENGETLDKRGSAKRVRTRIGTAVGGVGVGG